MIHSRFIGLLIGGLLCACGSDSGTDHRPSRPNVIIVSIDTLRADHLTPYGYDRPTSKHIGQLASESVIFEQAYSQSPKTAPSHMTIFTGLYPDAHGLRNWTQRQNWRISPRLPTLASILQQAGYRTEAYTGGGNIRAELGFDQGFDVYESVARTTSPFMRAAEALQGFAGRELDAPPFLLFVHTYGVHGPYTPPPIYAARFIDPRYDGAIIATQEELRKAAGSDEYDDKSRVYWSRVDPSKPADTQRLRDLYDASIAATDSMLGAFLKQVADLGLNDDTLVVLLSDHGEEFREHGYLEHSSLYQECLHVPLIIRFPPERDGIGNMRIPALVRLLDVTPTLLDYLGLPAPANLQGTSLMRLVRGEPMPPLEVLSMWHRHKAELYSLRVGPWKYVDYKGGAALFELARDPAEKRNRIGKTPERDGELIDRIKQLREESLLQAERLEADRRVVPMSDETRRELEALGYLRGEQG